MISVILPTYNRRHMIKKAIDSVLCQTCQDFELLIVDDCSTDDTISYLRDNYSDAQIRIIRNEVNLGAGGSRNRGVEQAKGEYLAFIDSDSEWYPDKLECQLQLFQEHPEAGMVYCIYDNHLPDRTIQVPFKEIAVQYRSGDIYGTLFMVPMVGTPTMLIRRETLQRVGAFRSELRALEDYELSLRIAREYPVYCYERALMISHFTPGGVSGNLDACLEARFYILREFREDLILCELYQDRLQELHSMCEEAGKLQEYEILFQKYLKVPK